MARGQDFAAKLRWWRQRRGWSQLDLAGHAGISQRHLSFLELGRASPSREMVIRLATALDISLRQHNALLLAAGFAPVWRETSLVAPELSQLRKAMDYILAQQEPFPAVVIDRHWNLIKANSGMDRLVEFLIGPLPPDAKVNLADALVAPDVLRPLLANWEEVVRYFIRSVEADAAADGDPRTAELLERLREYKGVRAALKTLTSGAGATPVLPMRLNKGGVSLQLFTTIATRDSAGRHCAGTTHRMLLPDGRRDRWHTARLEHEAEIEAPVESPRNAVSAPPVLHGPIRRGPAQACAPTYYLTSS
jgi:transcriptional regulator with XRE-family HTH domain